jgi:hypothetical protein
MNGFCQKFTVHDELVNIFDIFCAYRFLSLMVKFLVILPLIFFLLNGGYID